MKKLIIALAAAFFVSAVHAEYTAIEKVEVVKHQEASIDSNEALSGIAAKFGSDPDFSKAPAYLSVLGKLSDAADSAKLSWNWLNAIYEESINFSRLPREEELANAQSKLAQMRDRIAAAVDGMQALSGVDSEIAQANNAIALIDSMDWTLPYADPYPASYPRIIGPHGFYAASQAHIQHAREYIQKAFRRMVNGLGDSEMTYSADVVRLAGRFFKFGVQALNAQVRVMGIDVQAPIPADAGPIAADCQAGSGLRPCSFFPLLRAIEIAFAASGGTNWHGRSFGSGASQDLRQMNNYVRETLEAVAIVNTLDVVRRQLAGDGIAGAFNNIGDAWAGMDGYGQDAIMFKFEIPAPPGTAPTVSCLSENAVMLLDGSMPGTCVPRLGPNAVIDSTLSPPAVVGTVGSGPPLDTTIRVEEPGMTSVFEGRRVE